MPADSRRPFAPGAAVSSGRGSGFGWILALIVGLALAAVLLPFTAALLAGA